MGPPYLAWPARKASTAEARVTAKTTMAKTAALAHSTGRRRGTAQKVAKIMPVEYSPVITSTPRTLTVSVAKCTPNRSWSIGL